MQKASSWCTDFSAIRAIPSPKGTWALPQSVRDVHTPKSHFPSITKTRGSFSDKWDTRAVSHMVITDGILHITHWYMYTLLHYKLLWDRGSNREQVVIREYKQSISNYERVHLWRLHDRGAAASTTMTSSSSSMIFLMASATVSLWLPKYEWKLSIFMWEKKNKQNKNSSDPLTHSETNAVNVPQVRA